MIDRLTPSESQTPSKGESYFDGYQAAPLLIIGEDANPELVAAQDSLIEGIGDLTRTELGGYVKKNVVEFTVQSIASRMHLREGLNGSSFLQRTHAHPQYDSLPNVSRDVVDEACEKIKYGTGTAIQNEIARLAFGMKSVEYRNLTIVGEKRKYLEEPMWDEISELVGEDARPNPDRVYGMQLLGFDRDIRSSAHIGAMRIGMKQYLGTTQYGADVKVRTTAIINMSPSTGVDRHLVDLYRDTARKGGSISELPEFRNCVSWLIRNKLPEGLVLARNETPYGVETFQA